MQFGRLTAMAALTAVGWLGASAAGAGPVADRFQPMDPRQVQLEGFLGQGVKASEQGLLLHKDEDALLAGFEHRPGKQAWIGEHVGKWLHAATLAWLNTGDPRLKAKLDRVVQRLIATQEPDGYLGTYRHDQRFGIYPNADWDVWVHKYDLIGLLTYYQAARDPRALAAARKVGDLLIATFGPGKKSIVTAGTHEGMAATSVLEPIVGLYTATHDPKYLDFARHIVESYNDPHGPGIIRSILGSGSVKRTANAKAYEMLSNFVGLAELERATGDPTLRTVLERAWDDVVAHRLYITGTASHGEHFEETGTLTNTGPVGETCVTVTWIQLNWQLLRLHGEAKYADQIEKSVYNHLLGAQRPNGREFCYYTPLQGAKGYHSSMDCCTSSGPRGLALLPTCAVMTTAGGIVVNLFTTSTARTMVGGQPVEVHQRTGYPVDGRVRIEVIPRGKAGDAADEFSLLVRIPGWAAAPVVTLNGRKLAQEVRPGHYLTIRRHWKPDDAVEFTLDLTPRVVRGTGNNRGDLAIARGPMVYCFEDRYNPGVGDFVLAGATPERLDLRVVPAPPGTAEYPGKLLIAARAVGGNTASPRTIFLSDFADAGSDGSAYRVWLPGPDQQLPSQVSSGSGPSSK